MQALFMKIFMGTLSIILKSQRDASASCDKPGNELPGYFRSFLQYEAICFCVKSIIEVASDFGARAK